VELLRVGAQNFGVCRLYFDVVNPERTSQFADTAISQPNLRERKFVLLPEHAVG
jgi:hypothetical protein